MKLCNSRRNSEQDGTMFHQGDTRVKNKGGVGMREASPKRTGLRPPEPRQDRGGFNFPDKFSEDSDKDDVCTLFALKSVEVSDFSRFPWVNLQNIRSRTANFKKKHYDYLWSVAYFTAHCIDRHQREGYTTQELYEEQQRVFNEHCDWEPWSSRPDNYRCFRAVRALRENKTPDPGSFLTKSSRFSVWQMALGYKHDTKEVREIQKAQEQLLGKQMPWPKVVYTIQDYLAQRDQPKPTSEKAEAARPSPSVNKGKEAPQPTNDLARTQSSAKRANSESFDALEASRKKSKTSIVPEPSSTQVSSQAPLNMVGNPLAGPSNQNSPATDAAAAVHMMDVDNGRLQKEWVGYYSREHELEAIQQGWQSEYLADAKFIDMGASMGHCPHGDIEWTYSDANQHVPDCMMFKDDAMTKDPRQLISMGVDPRCVLVATMLPDEAIAGAGAKTWATIKAEFDQHYAESVEAYSVPAAKPLQLDASALSHPFTIAVQMDANINQKVACGRINAVATKAAQMKKEISVMKRAVQEKEKRLDSMMASMSEYSSAQQRLWLEGTQPAMRDATRHTGLRPAASSDQQHQIPSQMAQGMGRGSGRFPGFQNVMR